jgi:hypothetical protein
MEESTVEEDNEGNGQVLECSLARALAGDSNSTQQWQCWMQAGQSDDSRNKRRWQLSPVRNRFFSFSLT